MAKYTEEQLNTCSKEMLVTLLLSMQDQLEQLNRNFEKLSEQLAVMNNQRYGRSSEKLSVMDGQLSLELIFNEAEAVMETLYVVEPEEDQVLPKKKRTVGKREADLKNLPEATVICGYSGPGSIIKILLLSCMIIRRHEVPIIRKGS